MREGSAGGQDSRPAKEPPAQQGRDAAGGDTYDLYRRVLEALARAQFDAGHYAAAAGNFRRIVEASPTDDYAQFGLGLALARTGDPGAAAEHLALAVAMQPDRRHYTDALRSVRATLQARTQAQNPSTESPERKTRGV